MLESSGRCGYDSGKRRKGSKVHMAVGTLGHLLAIHDLRIKVMSDRNHDFGAPDQGSTSVTENPGFNVPSL